jgi:hypothetical protein
VSHPAAIIPLDLTVLPQPLVSSADAIPPRRSRFGEEKDRWTENGWVDGRRLPSGVLFFSCVLYFFSLPLSHNAHHDVHFDGFVFFFSLLYVSSSVCLCMYKF